MKKILVTAIGGGGVGDQILKAITKIDPQKYEVYGCDSSVYPAQAMQVKEYSQIELASDELYLDNLLALCLKWKIDVLFVGCEPELKKIADNRNIFEDAGILVPINSASLIHLCMNKSALNKTLSSLGFSVPKHREIFSSESISEIDWFPVVVKPSGYSGGSADVYIAQSANELQALVQYLGLGTNVGSLLVEEYVGTPNDEFTVGILHDLDGNFIDSIALNRDLSGGLNVRLSVRNRSNKSKLGNRLVISSGVSQGKIGKFKNVTDQCRTIAEALGSHGPLNIQCRIVDGVVYVFEINPRHSGTTSLRSMIGFNEPDLLIQRHLDHNEIEIDQQWPIVKIERTLVEQIVFTV